MITCTNCNHEALLGTLFCIQCGIHLENAQNESSLITLQTETTDYPIPLDNLPNQEPGVNSTHSLRFIQTGDIIPLINNGDITLGRATSGQSVIPDIDLTQYKGYRDGVSRLHATLIFRGERLLIKDLGSVNGTRINGEKIAPNSEFILHHEDVISLGNLSVQILIF